MKLVGDEHAVRHDEKGVRAIALSSSIIIFGCPRF
jgi:hypothetical protein